jgi:hypothetical protein
LRNSTLICLSIRYRKLPGRVNSFLDAIANNEMKIKVEEIDEGKLMKGFQKIANRLGHRRLDRRRSEIVAHLTCASKTRHQK